MKKITLILGILVAANILVAQNKRAEVRERGKVKIEEFKDRLNLTEAQVADLQQLREEMKPDFEALKKDESMSRPDKMRAHADLIEERQAEVEKILDDEQLAEWKEIQKEVKEKRGERRERRHDRRENKGDN